MLDVRRLRVLREVAAQGSFSAAAEALAFTQPAVSRQIATLEAEAGTRLVERSARGIRLTPAGELLVGHAEAILDRLATAESQLAALADGTRGRLRLAAFPSANATLIPLAIAAFRGARRDRAAARRAGHVSRAGGTGRGRARPRRRVVGRRAGGRRTASRASR